MLVVPSHGGRGFGQLHEVDKHQICNYAVCGSKVLYFIKIEIVKDGWKMGNRYKTNQRSLQSIVEAYEVGFLCEAYKVGFCVQALFVVLVSLVH